MLVLGRKAGQRLLIGEQVVVTVVAVCGSQVRLGIDAPTEVAIRRDELCGAVIDETTCLLRKKKRPRSRRCGSIQAQKEA
jgi:carbon storage regulator